MRLKSRSIYGHHGIAKQESRCSNQKICKGNSLCPRSAPKALALTLPTEYDSFAPKISAVLHVLFISTAEKYSLLKAGEVMV